MNENEATNPSIEQTSTGLARSCHTLGRTMMPRSIIANLSLGAQK
jgi:hypothetical protein